MSTFMALSAFFSLKDCPEAREAIESLAAWLTDQFDFEYSSALNSRSGTIDVEITGGSETSWSGATEIEERLKALYPWVVEPVTVESICDNEDYSFHIGTESQCLRLESEQTFRRVVEFSLPRLLDYHLRELRQRIQQRLDQL